MSFIPYLKNQGQNFCLEELLQGQYCQPKKMCNHMLCYTSSSLLPYKLLLKDFMLPSTSPLNKIAGCNVVVSKIANLLYQNGSLSKIAMVVFNEIVKILPRICSCSCCLYSDSLFLATFRPTFVDF